MFGELVALGALLLLLQLREALADSHAVPVADARPPVAQAPTVLAIGAHPDDIEFGCGAALLRYRASGYHTRAIVLTNGENGGRASPDATAPIRCREARDAGSILGLESLEFMALPDAHLSARRKEVRTVIEQKVADYRPDIVLTHTGRDLHSDHRTVFSSTIEACRHVPTVLCYENPNTPANFHPNVFIDVTQFIERKIDALNCHASQCEKSYFKADLIRSIARMRGNQAQVGFAEGFEAVRVRSESL